LSKNLAGLAKTGGFVGNAGDKGNSVLFQGHNTIGAAPEDRRKDFFFLSGVPRRRQRRGNTKSPVEIEALSFSGWGAGWGAWPVNQTCLLATWHYGSKCGNFTHILKFPVI
jgi:hypothetical protein